MAREVARALERTAGTAPRLVSLLPAATEWVYALGCGDWLVGVSHECDYPPAVRQLPVLTSTRVNQNGSCAEIDQQVRAGTASQESLYELDTARLRELAPDLILVQETCKVCGVSAAWLRSALGSELAARTAVLSFTARDLSGIYADVARLGAALRCEERAAAAVQALEREVQQIRWRSQRARYRPRVLCLEWIEPPIVAGHWIPELVENAGGQTVLAQSGQPGRRVAWADIRESQPEVVILMPCGFSLARVMQEVERWVRPAEWWSLPAVENGRIYAVESNAFLNRPGPRIRESARLLAGVIQPALFASLVPDASVSRFDR